MSFWSFLAQSAAPWWSTAATTLCGGAGGALIAGKLAKANDTRKAERERAQSLSDQGREQVLALLAASDDVVTWHRDLERGQARESQQAKTWDLQHRIIEAKNMLFIVGSAEVFDHALKLSILVERLINHVRKDGTENTFGLMLLIGDHYNDLLNATRKELDLPEYPKARFKEASQEALSKADEVQTALDDAKKSTESAVRRAGEENGYGAALSIAAQAMTKAAADIAREKTPQSIAVAIAVTEATIKPLDELRELA